MTDSPKLDASPRMRVLTMGDNQSFFVAILCREIKRRCPEIEFYICDYIKYGANVGYDEENTFTAQFKSPPLFEFHVKMLRAIVGAAFSAHLYRRMARTMACFGLAGRYIIDAAARSLGKAVQIERFRNEVLRQQFFDVWHFHFCTPSSLRYVDIAPAQTKVVCSFWGSDLLRSAAIESHVPVSVALERADAITVQSVELREIIMCRFGRHLRSKIHYCRFPAATSSYERIAALCGQGSGGRANAKKQLGLPGDRTIIGVGHNGDRGDKHPEILAGWERLPDEVKQRVFLVLPMTYGLTAAYGKTVEAACQRTGIEYLILKEYLSRDALAALRVAVDITIFMPESDAMSAAALETIYAGNVLVAGVWLPYGPYRRLGLPYVEVEDYGQLAQVIPPLLDRARVSEAELAPIQKRIEGAFCADGTAPAWINMYRSLVKSYD